MIGRSAGPIKQALIGEITFLDGGLLVASHDADLLAHPEPTQRVADQLEHANQYATELLMHARRPLLHALVYSNNTIDSGGFQ